jgi:tRNA dimethylallyltransferase
VSGAGGHAPGAIDPSPPLLVIAGPTATGKTGLSLRLVQALAEGDAAAEVISADARQVYRGLDIGTAKVDRATRARVRHHGLDLVDPDIRFSVADYADHVTTELAGIAERGSLALLVGGTGLYLRAIARGLALDALPSDAQLREQLEQELAEQGPEAQVARLRAMAPSLASRTDLRNPRRVTRVLEIALLRGDGPLPVPYGYPGPSAWIGLDAPPEVHREWIATRARGQFEHGLVDEARTLRERWDPDLPAFSAIGYREAFALLDGDVDLDEAVDLDARRNVAFARRQRTWFRSEPDIEWLDATVDPLPAALASARSLVARRRGPARVS